MICERHGGPRDEERPLTEKWPVDDERVVDGKPEVLSDRELVEALIYEGYSVREMYSCPCRLNSLRAEAMLRLEHQTL